MRKKGEFESIGIILKRFIKKNSLTSKFIEEKIKRKWREIVGEEIYKHITPLYIKSDILYVKVEDSNWNSELSFLKKEILEKINLNMDKNKINNIRAKI